MAKTSDAIVDLPSSILDLLASLLEYFRSVKAFESRPPGITCYLYPPYAIGGVTGLQRPTSVEHDPYMKWWWSINAANSYLDPFPDNDRPQVALFYWNKKTRIT